MSDNAIFKDCIPILSKEFNGRLLYGACLGEFMTFAWNNNIHYICVNWSNKGRIKSFWIFNNFKALAVCWIADPFGSFTTSLWSTNGILVIPVNTLEPCPHCSGTIETGIVSCLFKTLITLGSRPSKLIWMQPAGFDGNNQFHGIQHRSFQRNPYLETETGTVSLYQHGMAKPWFSGANALNLISKLTSNQQPEVPKPLLRSLPLIIVHWKSRPGPFACLF